ncbi:MAG: hypothetical protein JJD92_06240 [Frankiaceae bacterium]|nr:hypothetical protein [Frankiaceae bacterium]
MARFYVQLLGLEVTADEGDWIALRDPAGAWG